MGSPSLGASIRQAKRARSDKRRRAQELFDQKKAIEQEMAKLDQELLDLDETIEQMELTAASQTSEIIMQNSSTSTVKQEKKDLVDDSIIEEHDTKEAQHEIIAIDDDEDNQNNVNSTIHSYTQAPQDEILTDPFTAATQTQRSPDAIASHKQSTAATSSGIAPLDFFAPRHSRKRARTTETNGASAAASSNNDPFSQSTSTTSPQSYPWTVLLRELLENTFQIPSYREHQEEIINATLSQQDVFVLMRTGGGKSLTYQAPAIYEGRLSDEKKVTLVISPLLSLIQDQEEQMNQFLPGSATSFTSGLPGGSSEHARRWGMVRDPDGGICLIFVTPEKVNRCQDFFEAFFCLFLFLTLSSLFLTKVHKSTKLRNELQKLYDQGRLGRFVVDEAHCACQWGCDFRPDYAQLGILKRHFPSVPVLAVTATASTRVREDVVRILGMDRHYRFFRSTAHRPNLQYQIRPKGDKCLADMAEWIQQLPGPAKQNGGIVYCLSRKDADNVAKALKQDYGITARAYHSDVSANQKQSVHRDWMAGKVQCVVATIAFGLGINKPNVRFVIHHCISKTLEAYYQESGRAGRDGKDAHCILYYSPKDVIRLRTLVHETHRGEDNLWPMIRYAQAFGNDAVCKAILLDNLGEPNAQSPIDVQKQFDGVTTEPRDVGKHAQVAVRLVHDAVQEGQDVTMAMIVKKWRSKKDAPSYVEKCQPNKDLTVEECERIVVALLVERVLQFYIHWTAYSAVAYLRPGQPLAQRLLASPSPKMIVRFPKRELTAASAKKTATRKKSDTPESGRLSSNSKSKSSRSTTTKKAAAKKKPSTAKSKRITATKKRIVKKTATRKAPPSETTDRASSETARTEPIDLSSDDDKVVENIPLQAKSGGDQSSDSEFEFDG